MKLTKYVLLTALISLTFAGCGTMKKAALTNQHVKVVSIINQMPAQSSQQQDQLAAELASLNPQATQILVDMLQPPTNPTDNAARYGISGLTHYTSHAGDETARKVYAKTLIKALPTVPDEHNKAFIITQLQLVGKREAVKPLAAYLGDTYLCDYAARALLSIGTKGVEPAFLKALDSADSVTRPSIIKALVCRQQRCLYA